MSEWGPALLAVTLLALVGIPATVRSAIWVLRPVDEAARQYKDPNQFTLVDVACLFFLIQLSMVIGHGWLRGARPEFVGIIDVYLWIAAAVLWWYGVQHISRAGVRNSWHRAVFLGFVVPATLSAAVGIPCVLLGILFWHERPLTTAFLIAVEFLLLAGVYVSGRLTRWIVGKASLSRPDIAG
jgi:hypothetical protein